MFTDSKKLFPLFKKSCFSKLQLSNLQNQLSSKKQIHSERQINGFSILDCVCFPSEAIAYIEVSAFADRLKYGGGLFTLKLELLGTT